jgi:hypothetical protein
LKLLEERVYLAAADSELVLLESELVVAFGMVLIVRVEELWALIFAAKAFLAVLAISPAASSAQEDLRRSHLRFL